MPALGVRRISQASRLVTLALSAGSRAGIAGDQAAPLQEAVEAARILAGQLVIDVGLAAELDGRGEDGRRHRIVRPDFLLQPVPGQEEGLVERGRAEIVAQQHRRRADLGGQVLGARPEHVGGVDVHQRDVVAMQVEHEIGIVGEAHQLAPQLGILADRIDLIDGLAQRLAHDRDVGVRVFAELALHLGGETLGQIGPAAIEVDAAAEIVAAGEGGVDDLARADRIGDRHHDDLALDLAARGGVVEQADQVMRRQHARNLVGVERGLQIGLRPRARLAVAVRLHEALGARTHGIQIDALNDFAHGKLF